MADVYVPLDQNRSLNLETPMRAVYVFNPTRDFIYITPGDNAIPSALDARFKIPPNSERMFPLDSVTSFGIAVLLPNPTNPAYAKFYPTPQNAAIAGQSFQTPIDPPVLLDAVALTALPASTGYQVKMVGRWFRLHWAVETNPGPTAPLFITLTDGIERYRLRIENQKPNLTVNWSDFAFRTNQTVTITVEPGFVLDQWGYTLWYEFLDRAEREFPVAHRMATRARFRQANALPLGTPISWNFDSGFRGFAIGAHLRGVTGIPRDWSLVLTDLNSGAFYFNWQPKNYGAAALPTDPDSVIILPGDVQNYAGAPDAGQVLPVGSVTNFAANTYQLARGLDITVFAESVLTFQCNDQDIDIANFFIEGYEPF